MKFSIYSSPGELNQLLLDVADLRRLLLQDIFVGQSNTKTVEQMWARFNEARQSGTETVLKCQKLEDETSRLKTEVSAAHAALHNASTVRQSLEQRIADREKTITELQHRLTSCEDVNRDFAICTTRLSEAIFDLAGATDIEAETKRVQVRYDQLELRCAHLQRVAARTSEEKSMLERQLHQWAESHHQLRTQSADVIASRERTIELQHAVMVENGLRLPTTTG